MTASSSTAFVEGHGARLFTRVDGQEGAPWIFLTNSVGADHTMWDGQIELLTRKYRVLRHDSRGHGKSDAPPGAYSFPMLVADIAAIFDHYGVGKAAFMGLSLGGMTGIGFVLAYPDRVERFVCCDARAEGNEAFVKSWDDRIAIIAEKGMAGIVQPTLERWLVASFRESHPAETRKVATMFTNTPVPGYIGCAHALKTLDYGGVIGNIAVPTLFVVGAEDTGAPPDAMRKMAEQVKGARLAVVADAAHVPCVDNPAGFQAAIADLLGLPH